MSVCNRVAWWGMVVAVASVRLDQRLAFGTLGAETLDGVVDGLDTIAFRQGDYGYLDVLDAEWRFSTRQTVDSQRHISYFVDPLPSSNE